MTEEEKFIGKDNMPDDAAWMGDQDNSGVGAITKLSEIPADLEEMLLLSNMSETRAAALIELYSEAERYNQEPIKRWVTRTIAASAGRMGAARSEIVGVAHGSGDFVRAASQRDEGNVMRRIAQRLGAGRTRQNEIDGGQ